MSTTAKFVPIELPLICQGMEISIPLENIRNKSDQYTANDVIVDVSVPPGVVYSRHNLPRGTYDPVTNVWDVGSLAPLESLTGEVLFYVTNDCLGKYKFKYTVGTTNNCADPDTSDNAVCVLVSGLSCCQINTKCNENLALDNIFVVPKEIGYPIDVSVNDGNCPAATARTYQWVELPKFGILTGTPDSGTYTPSPGFCGVDRAVYAMYCDGSLRDKAVVQFNVTCAQPVSDNFTTGINSQLIANVSGNDFPCINGGITKYILSSNDNANSSGLTEPTSQTEVIVTQWNQTTGGFTVLPSGGFIGVAQFNYYITCEDPVSGLIWNSPPVTVSINVPTAYANAGSNLCSGNVLTYDTPCTSGVTTAGLTAASEVNCSATVNASGAYDVIVTDLSLAWEFGYTIFCDGVPTDTGTVSGGPVTATANDDNEGSVALEQQTIMIGANDVPCSQGITSYALDAGSLSNVVVDEFNPLTGLVKYTPQSIAAWEFDYDVICTVCGTVQVMDTATVSGTVAASSSVAPSSSNAPASSSSPPASSSNVPSSSVAPSSSGPAASSSGAPASSNTP